jgi:hypothetical protein
MSAEETLRAALQPMFDQMRVRAEIVEPDDSYWYHRPARNFPPPTVQQPTAYDGGERLSLEITQTGLGAARQKALVKQWCDLLPTLANVRTLWFHSKVSQEMFAAACAMPALEGLYIKWSSITSLAPIAALRGLTHLHLGGAPSAAHIEAIATLPALVDLEIAKAPVGDLAWLAPLAPRLRALEVSGDKNSLKSLQLASLAPLAALRELERLNLTTLRVADESLASLADLPKLKYLGLANMFPMAEFARLQGRRPDIVCDRFVAFEGPTNWNACKKCKQHSMVMLIGKGQPWLCQTCDAERLAKHAAAYETIRAAAAPG